MEGLGFRVLRVLRVWALGFLGLGVFRVYLARVFRFRF